MCGNLVPCPCSAFKGNSRQRQGACLHCGSDCQMLTGRSISIHNLRRTRPASCTKSPNLQSARRCYSICRRPDNGRRIAAGCCTGCWVWCTTLGCRSRSSQIDPHRDADCTSSSQAAVTTCSGGESHSTAVGSLLHHTATAAPNVAAPANGSVCKKGEPCNQDAADETLSMPKARDIDDFPGA